MRMGIIDYLKKILPESPSLLKRKPQEARLSATTIELIEKIFPPDQQNEVTNILLCKCGNNLLDHENDDEHELERVRFAVLKMSKGDIERLRRAVKLAQEDWRDAFLAAGFEVSTTAHKVWAKEIVAINRSNKTS
jgi:hypothetical protein